MWAQRSDCDKNLLEELFSAGVPVVLIINRSPASLDWATKTARQYDNVIGVVLKPLTEGQCRQILEQARNTIMKRLLLNSLEELLLVERDKSEEKKTARAVVTEDVVTQMLAPTEEIVYVEARWGRCLAHTAEARKISLPQTLDDIVANRAEQGASAPSQSTLVRIHKHYAVNPLFVQKVQRSPLQERLSYRAEGRN